MSKTLWFQGGNALSTDKVIATLQFRKQENGLAHLLSHRSTAQECLNNNILHTVLVCFYLLADIETFSVLGFHKTQNLSRFYLKNIYLSKYSCVKWLGEIIII